MDEPFQPLQSYHRHLYASTKRQQKLRHKSAKIIAPSTRAKSSPACLQTSDSTNNIVTSNHHKPPTSNHAPHSGDHASKEPRRRASKLSMFALFQKRDTHVTRSILPERPSDPTPIVHEGAHEAREEETERHLQTTWTLPPLFQAYPQSLLNAVLKTPAQSPESLIRSQGQEVHEWRDKVFVLVTEGFILQYNGHGAYDRPPEKVLPLCRDSAAFASDVVLGSPFVLQVSHLSTDGQLDLSRSAALMKQAGFKGETRRAVSSLLLVFPDADQLTVWLTALRKAVEALGGKEYRPETFGTDGRETLVDPLARVPSQRYLVKRHPHRFSTKRVEAENWPGKLTVLPEGPSVLESPQRVATPCLEASRSRYTSNTQVSIDQIQLDNLRDSKRQSRCTSDEVKTASTSRSSSGDRSGLRAASPPAPNFSVPTFSKRFSVASTSTTHSHRGHSATPSVQVPEGEMDDRQYRRRHSSLEHARGVSPLSRLPPPQCPLPPVPDMMRRRSYVTLPRYPPPNGPLPAVPKAKSADAVPGARLRRPASMQCGMNAATSSLQVPSVPDLPILRSPPTAILRPSGDSFIPPAVRSTQSDLEGCQDQDSQRCSGQGALRSQIDAQPTQGETRNQASEADHSHQAQSLRFAHTGQNGPQALQTDLHPNQADSLTVASDHGKAAVIPPQSSASDRGITLLPNTPDQGLAHPVSAFVSSPHHGKREETLQVLPQASPPRPTRPPPALPQTEPRKETVDPKHEASIKSLLRSAPHRLARKSMPRLLGRSDRVPTFAAVTPPTPTKLDIPTESAISRDDKSPIIPPIEIPRSRLSRSSMDGPWNAEYGAPRCERIPVS